jgi:hypothetical protein
MKKATKKEILEMALTMEKKYFDLVWFARKTDEDYNTIPLAKEAMDRIMDQYEEEVDNLSGIDGDWHHGFNSGCLAAFRLILGMADYGVEEAIEEFPFLDS